MVSAKSISEKGISHFKILNLLKKNMEFEWSKKKKNVISFPQYSILYKVCGMKIELETALIKT